MSAFTHSIHALCAALHGQNIDPAKMTIILPHDEWWSLWTSLQREYENVLVYDGRGTLPGEFLYMGIKFQVRA